jgi:hemerythrin
MSKSGFVQWQDSYSIGIALIDEQHKELIRLTNKLYESCMKGRDISRTVFLETIRNAVKYIDYHFTTEKNIMIRVNYPEFEAHQQQHTEFIREVLHEVEDFTNGKPFSPNNFVHYLKDWILSHIAVTDHKLGNYLITMQKEGRFSHIAITKKQDQSEELIVD